MQARILNLHHKTKKHLAKLKKEAEVDGKYRIAKRIHSVILNSQGNTSGKIAKLINSPRSCVTEWLGNYEKNGIDGLLEGHHSGRPALLSKKQKINLADIIDSGPVAYGFVSGVWTSIMITKVIQEEFSIKYHPGHVRKILYDLGFSLQRPKKLLAKADSKKQNKWIRYTYPSIKKKRKI